MLANKFIDKFKIYVKDNHKEDIELTQMQFINFFKHIRIGVPEVSTSYIRFGQGDARKRVLINLRPIGYNPDNNNRN